MKSPLLNNRYSQMEAKVESVEQAAQDWLMNRDFKSDFTRISAFIAGVEWQAKKCEEVMANFKDTIYQHENQIEEQHEHIGKLKSHRESIRKAWFQSLENEKKLEKALQGMVYLFESAIIPNLPPTKNEPAYIAATRALESNKEK